MSTSNFYKINANFYYIIDFEQNEWAWENAHIIVAKAIKQIDKDFLIDYTIKSRYELRSHPSISLGEFVYSFKALGEEWEIYFTIFMRNGYYTGATLDWEIRIPSYSGTYENEDDIIEDIEEAIERGDIKGWNKGLWAIHRPKIEKKFKETIEKGIRHVEHILYQVSYRKMIKIAQFSNGEAVYQDYETV